jgi:hypothetical protein
LSDIILKRCKLGIVDTSKPVTLYVDEGQNFINAMLAQGSGEDLIICDFASREFLVSESSAPRIERLLIGAIWAIKRFNRYTYHSPQIYISLPLQAEVYVATCGTTLSPKL